MIRVFRTSNGNELWSVTGEPSLVAVDRRALALGLGATPMSASERNAVLRAVEETRDTESFDVIVCASGALYRVVRREETEPPPAPVTVVEWRSAHPGSRVLVVGAEPRALRLAHALEFVGYDAVHSDTASHDLGQLAWSLEAHRPDAVVFADGSREELVALCRSRRCPVAVVGPSSAGGDAALPSELVTARLARAIDPLVAGRRGPSAPS